MLLFFLSCVVHVHISTRLFSLSTFSHLLLSPAPQLTSVHANAVPLRLRYARLFLVCSFILFLHYAVLILLPLMNKLIPLQV
jgi:hypothetical protein